MLEQGMYRIDADSARLWVFNGKVQVSDGDDQRRLSVEQGMYLRFAAILLPERSVDQPRDVFSTWIKSRQQTIAADNAIAASTQDPASIPNPALARASNSRNGFTLPIRAQVAVVGASVGLISYAYFSTSQRRNSALLPSTQYGFARVVSDAPPRSARSNSIRAVRLLMPLSTRVPLRLSVPVRPVSGIRFLGGVR